MNGWLILDKPLGITSAHAVAKVKRLLKPSKIGHGGTLDPLASGILPLALGEGTKSVQFMMVTTKAYRFSVTWGESRSTDDAEGEVTARSDVRPTAAQIMAILSQFTGPIQQTPPIYSAVHVDGKRAYAMARAGEEVVLAAREVQVYSLCHASLRRHDNNINQPIDISTFEVTCGKGTYVRSLARDMAAALGTVGYVSALRRTAVGRFNESHAISLENLEKMVHNGALNWLHPVESVLDDIPAWEVNSALATRIRHGQPLAVDPAMNLSQQALVRVKSGGELVAICRVEGRAMTSVRVFN